MNKQKAIEAAIISIPLGAIITKDDFVIGRGLTNFNSSWCNYNPLTPLIARKRDIFQFLLVQL
jgi:hypothetical protein